jgi:DNA-binding LacI/PurR family transcriptional regulator
MSHLRLGFEYALECRIDDFGKSDSRIMQYLEQVRPTAVICATSEHSADLVRIFGELSPNARPGFSVVAFEDTPSSSLRSPAVIRVTAHPSELGRAAVRHLSFLQLWQPSETHPDSAVNIKVSVRLTQSNLV